MRIAFANPFFHPVTGGVETRIRELATRLAARGHDVEVHAMAATPDRRDLPAGPDAVGAVRVVRWKPDVQRGGYAFLFRPRIERADVVDVNSYPNPMADWLARNLPRGAALVLTPHGTHFVPPTRFGRAAKRLYDTLAGLRTLRRARRIVVMTRAETDWLAARGIPGARVAVVPSGVDASAVEPRDPRPTTQRLGLTVGEYLVAVGRLYHEKSPLDLVRAFGLLADEHPHLRLVLAGPDQGEGAAIDAEAERLGLGRRVLRTGLVSEEDKMRLLAGSALLVHASAWEAQGIVFLEAAAQGRPVVAAAVGGVPHVVLHGETGLLYPHGDVRALADAVRSVLADPERAMTMGRRARERVRSEFLWDHIVTKAERTYEEAERSGRTLETSRAWRSLA